MIDHTQVHDMDLQQLTRVLRALDEKNRNAVSGLNGDEVLVRCKDEDRLKAWLSNWKELTE
jgi:hypothetical protein